MRFSWGKGLLGLIIVSLAILFLYPWKAVVVVPAIRVRVLDEKGNPAPGVILKQKWEYRVIGSEGHQELSRADEKGHAFFKERTERISLLKFVISFAREIVHLPHGYGFGSWVTVWAYGEDPYVWSYVPFSWYETFPEEIRLRRQSQPRTPEETTWP
jgi:hypothetical protein